MLHVSLSFKTGLTWQENIEIALQSYALMSQSNFVFDADLDEQASVVISAFQYESPVTLFCDTESGKYLLI